MTKPIFKKGDILYEDCGCQWEVMSAPKTHTDYIVRHVFDGDTVKWDQKNLEKQYKKGHLWIRPVPKD